MQNLAKLGSQPGKRERLGDQLHPWIKPPVMDDRVSRIPTGEQHLQTRSSAACLVGQLPAPQELQDFLADSSPTKRADVVRRLLSEKRAFADHWLSFWNDLLRNEYKGTGYIDGGRKQITAG